MHKAVAHGLQPCLHFKNGSQPLSHALRLVAGVSLGPNLRVAIGEAQEALDNFVVTGRLTVLPPPSFPHTHAHFYTYKHLEHALA